MKTHLLTAIGFAAIASLAVFALPAQASDWTPTFRSEQGIIKASSAREASDLQKRYHLQAGFTAKEFGDAVAEHIIKRLRHDYDLGTNFTSDEFAANAGANDVAYLMKEYNLPTHFTLDQLRAAVAKESETYATQDHPGLPLHYSFADFKRIVGAQKADKLARKYHLPRAWVYSDLVNEAGPEGAASYRLDAGFARNATHAEIEAALGEEAATRYAKDHNLPVGFTSADLEKASLGWKYSDFYKLPPHYGDADLVTWYGSKDLRWFARDHHVSAKFTEASLRNALAAQAIVRIEHEYDLDANFTEADLVRAVGLSAAASVRNQYNLRHNFTAAEYKAAFNSKTCSTYPICY